MSALRWLTTTVMRGCGWIRCTAHCGRTWTRSTPSGTRPGGRSCGGASDSVPRRWDGGILVGLVSGSTVDGLRQLLGASGWFFHVLYVMVFSDPEVASSHSCCFSCFPAPVALGNWTLRLRAPCIWQFLVRCCGVLFMMQCLVQQRIHVMRQLLMRLDGFVREEDLVS